MHRVLLIAKGTAPFSVVHIGMTTGVRVLAVEMHMDRDHTFRARSPAFFIAFLPYPLCDGGLRESC